MVVGRLSNRTRHRDFEKSMTTMMTLLPLDLGRLVRKSMSMWDQGCCGVGSGMSLLTSRVCGAVAWAHTGHDEMYLWISVSMLGHYLDFHRLYVQCVLG